MRKFSFRLDAIRRLREQEEQLVQTELAGALRERARLEAELTASRLAESAIYDYLRSTQLSGAELAHVSQYGVLHRRHILDATIMVQQTDERIGRIRVRLTEARARREALDKLCERQRAEHHRLWLAEEMRELDEIAGQGRRRRAIESLAAARDEREAAA